MSKMLYTLALLPFLVTFSTQDEIESEAERLEPEVNRIDEPMPSSKVAIRRSQTSQWPEIERTLRSNFVSGLTHRGFGNDEAPIDKAIARYKIAKDTDSKKEAENDIRSELADQYETFLEQNAEQIEVLQTRLDELKQQLERRRDAKRKMVDLELERVLNEIDGLIFPRKNRSSVSRLGQFRRGFTRRGSNGNFREGNLPAQPSAPATIRLPAAQPLPSAR